MSPSDRGEATLSCQFCLLRLPRRRASRRKRFLRFRRGGPATCATAPAAGLSATVVNAINMVSEASYLSGQQRANYPGYRRIAGTPAKPYILSATILGTAGALWQFDSGHSKALMRVDILLFTWRQQSYTIKMTSLAGTDDSHWNKKILATMAAMLHTFTPLSA